MRRRKPVDRDEREIGFALAQVKAAGLLRKTCMKPASASLFRLSIALKGLHALAEVAGGIALSLFSTDFDPAPALPSSTGTTGSPATSRPTSIIITPSTC